MQQPIPLTKRSSCSYCGNAPVNHKLYFLESLFTIPLDAHMVAVTRRVPNFIKEFVNLVPGVLFETLAVFGMVIFSDDIEKANTFRSKVIWEEAQRRGIKMQQIIFLGRGLDYYRAKLPFSGKLRNYYFESIPIRPEYLDMSKNWDDKIILKKELAKKNIPIPKFYNLSIWSLKNKNKKLAEVFAKLEKPIIVKPRVGSRGRHTITNIHTLKDFKEGVQISSEICSMLTVEEHLVGNVCRATFVDGSLAGFYRGNAPTLLGDGKKTIAELIEDKDKNRESRVEPIYVSAELHNYLARLGYKINNILEEGVKLPLTHRNGRFFGGQTKEMLDELHPSFLPILQAANNVVGLSVVGFDCIIPEPTEDANSQKWGIIECNTLPFIDLHYYALEGKPKNIAGMIWDMWDHP